MKVLTPIFLLFFITSNAQVRFNTLTVATHRPLIFTYNSTEDLLKDKVLENALEVSVGTLQEDATVQANIIFSSPNNSISLSNSLYLKLNYKTSDNAAIETKDLSLSLRPQPVFMQPKTTDNSPSHSFFYDLVLHSSQLALTPGTYNFTIVFTCQQRSGRNTMKQSVQGSIVIPPLQSVDVVYLNSGQLALHVDDLKDGKTIPDFCQVIVKSNIPWQVSVTTASNSVTDETQTTTISSSRFSIKPHTSNTYAELSTIPKVIQRGNSNQVLNTFDLDLKSDADYTVPGGNYTVPLFFTISPQ